MLLAENKTSAPKKFVPFTAMRVNLFLEKIFKYKRPNNKSLHLGRVRGLAYVHCEYLRLFNVWLLFSVALSPWQIFRLELSLFLPVEELLEKLEKIASTFKKIIKVWNILVTLYCYPSPGTATGAGRVSELCCVLNQGCPSCMSFMYAGVYWMAQIFLGMFEFEIAKARQKLLYKCSLQLFILVQDVRVWWLDFNFLY